MRVVLDTNILISALMIQAGSPAAIYRAWQAGHFTLLTCAEHLDELRATLRQPAIAERIKPYKAGGLVNQLKELAEIVESLPRIKPYKADGLVNQLKELAEIVESLPRIRRSPDPTDDFLLALSEAGRADYLAPGDKSGLLVLEQHKSTRIISARAFAALLA